MENRFDVLATITEKPTEFGEHTYTARQNAGEDRWQVFRDSELTPAGFFELHFCDADCPAPRKRVGMLHQLRVYDPNNQVYGQCVSSYLNVLSHLRMHGLGH